MSLTSSAPSGSLTLAFTDIPEAVTLWQRLGDRLKPALDLHVGLVRGCLAARRGYEVKTEGESFMVAFESAADAVGFALEAQEALAKAAWPAESGELRVGIGLHTGEPLCVPDVGTGRMDYFGPMVNRAARIAKAAHGGQTLISETTRAAAADALAGRAVLADLGEHRLKGLDRAERIWQVLPVSQAGRTFPPLATLTVRPTNLPLQTSTFIGREAELRRLGERLRDPAARLVTITGPGGTGKTRLALRLGNELLDRFEGGVWFADVSEAGDLPGIARAVAGALAVPLPPGEPPENAVANVLEYRRPLVLILDGCEPVAQAAAAAIARWHPRAPHVSFIATSQVRLALDFETEFPLDPLPVPPSTPLPLAKVAAFDAVRVFVDRAREADPAFTLTPANVADVATLCIELDGIPLALELAAARVRILKPAQLVQRLGQRFTLLKSTRRDLPPRQRTLLGAIEWSTSLLSDAERSAFHVLCAFRGGFFVEAASAVLEKAEETVRSLAEKSLLRGTPTPLGMRYSVASTMREYGSGQWNASASPGARRALEEKLEAYYLKYAEDWNARFHTAAGAEALERIDLERDNLFAVHETALAAHRPDVAARALIALVDSVLARGTAAPLISRLEASLASLPQDPTPLRLALLAAISQTAYTLGMWDRSLATAEEAVRLGESTPLTPSTSHALGLLARLRFSRGDTATALACLSKSEEIARSLNDRRGVSSALNSRGVMLDILRDPDGALACYAEARAISQEIGDRHGLALEISNRGLVLQRLGDLEGALASCREAENLFRSLGQHALAATHVSRRGSILVEMGRFAEALPCLLEAGEIFRRIGQKKSVPVTLSFLAHICYWRGDPSEALRHVDEATRLTRELGYKRNIAHGERQRGVLLLHLDDMAAARTAFANAAKLGLELNDKSVEPWILADRALLLEWEGKNAEALALREQAGTLLQGLTDRATHMEHLIARGRLLMLLGRLDEAAATLDEAEAFCRRCQAYPELSVALTERARVDLVRRKGAEARKRLAEVTSIHERMGTKVSWERFVVLALESLAARQLGEDGSKLAEQAREMAAELELEPTHANPEIRYAFEILNAK